MDLNEVAAKLEQAIAAMETRLQKQIDHSRENPAPYARAFDNMTPFDVRDDNGRFLLVDAYCALAKVKAAAA